MTSTYARIGAASGAVCVVSVMVGNGLALAGWSNEAGGASVLADLQRDLSVVNVIGLGLELLGWAALVMFLGFLYRVLQRAEAPDGWLAPVALGAGLIMVSIKLISIVPIMAAWYRRDDLTVATAQTLGDLADAAFIVSGWATGLLVTSAAGSALASAVLPRWLCWFGIVSGIATLVAGSAGIMYPASYVPLPFLSGLLWLLTTSLVLTARGSRGQALIAQPVASGVAARQ